MYHGFTNLWKDLLREGLREDGSPWDWTSLGVRREKNLQVSAKLIAKSEGIWAASSLLEAVSELEPSLRFATHVGEGTLFRPSDVLFTLEGAAEALLIYERPLMNLAAYACGIAYRTHVLVKKVREACPENPPRITATRKTLPGYRDLSIHALRCGGGYPHRVSLSGGILIKENHIAAAGSMEKAISGVRATAPHGLRLEIEVTSLEEFREASRLGAEIILLDNFTPEGVEEVLALKRSQPESFTSLIEVSGGLNEATISAYARPGVDFLSVGALTHSVEASDLSLLVEA